MSDRVEWIPDGDVQSSITISSAGSVTTAPGFTGSARVRASMTIEGVPTLSEPSYVFTSTNRRPAVLRVGSGAAWLTDDASHDDRTLIVEAFVAQRGNQVPLVFGLHPNTTIWGGMELKYDGQGSDKVAGDGIFTAALQGQDGLATGNNLKAVQAFMPPVGMHAFGGSVSPSSALASVPWPYVHVNSSPSAPWPTPAAPPAVTPEPTSYYAPRIIGMGYRGLSGSDELLMEVEVLETPFASSSPISATADISIAQAGGATLGLVNLTPQGGGIYTCKVSLANSASGIYVPHVAAFVLSGSNIVAGDYVPQIRVHQVPAWDMDEPADVDGNSATVELEPSGW